MSRPSRVRTFFHKLRLTSLRGGQRPAIIVRGRLLARLGVEPLEDRCLPAWTAIGPAPQQEGGGPVSGRISALAIANTHIQQVPTLFLGAAGGGVWTSISFTGDNPSYTPETDNLSITNADSGLGAGAIDVGSIAVDPNDTIGTIYVGTGEANGYGGSDSRYGTGILKSTDGGNTFQLIATGTAARPQAFFRHAISKIIVDPRNSKNLYAAVVPVPSANGGMPNGANQDDGIYRSQDAGATWVKITSGPQRGPQIGDSVTVTDMDYTWNKATNSLTLFAGVADGGHSEGGIWRSTDDGASWGQIGNTTGSIGTSDSEAVHPADVWRVALAADHTSGGTNVFAVIIKPGGSVLDVFKAWTGDGRNWRGFGPGNFTGDQGTYDVAIGLSPTNRLYVAGTSVFESADLAHWQNITTGGSGSKNPHTDDHAFAFTPDGKVYLGTDGGLWRYNPARAGVGTWDDLNTKWLQTHQLYGIALSPKNQNTLLEGSQDNNVARTTDGGATWNETAGGGDGGMVGYDGVIGYATYNGGGPGFLRSADGGASQPWRDLGPNDPNGWPFIPVMAQNPLNGSFIVLGSRGSVWETRNGGLPPSVGVGPAWVEIGKDRDAGETVSALAYGPPKVDAGLYSVYAAFSDGRIFRMDRNTTDFVPGTWTELAHPWGNRPVTGIATQPGRGVVWVTVGAFNDGGNSGQVFWSADYGQSWLTA